MPEAEIGAEQERLGASEVAVVGARLIEKQGFQALGAVLDNLSTRVSRVYVHVDLDVLDAEKVGKANEFATEGGPNAEELQAALGMVRERGSPLLRPGWRPTTRPSTLTDGSCARPSRARAR